MVRITESWHWSLVEVARGDDWLLHHATTLLEDEMIVVLVHLGDVLLHQLTVGQVLWVFLRVCEPELLMHRSEFLLSLDWVEDWSTDRHGLLQIRFGEFAQFLIVRESCLNGQCKCVSLCQESNLVVRFLSLKVLRIQQLDF